MVQRLTQLIKGVLSNQVLGVEPLSGGSVGKVFLIRLEDGEEVVAKVDESGVSRLDLEGKMLEYLSFHSHLPVPKVIHSSTTLLILRRIRGRNYFTKKGEEHAAELLADLHNIHADYYGFEYDTLIGGLHQPNPRSAQWLDFFRENRLHFMAQEAYTNGQLPKDVFARLERLCEKLEEYLSEPEQPSLIHGDAWAGNILSEKDRITGFIDPAIYFADPEIELAFTTLFRTFGSNFFGRYQEFRIIHPEFMEVRRHIYNLYPLLVHVRLFGGSYLNSVSQTLTRFGF